MAQSLPSRELKSIWEGAGGLFGWLTTVDHKTIGIRYIVTAFGVFLLAGTDAMMIRTQLIRPGNSFLSPASYNEYFTMHGTMMVFFFATPILFGFGNFLVPLLIGARDMAFPRLNAFGYWVYLFSAGFIYSSLLVGRVPTGGWFAYVPYTTREYTPGLGIDYYVLGLLFLGFATTAGAINFIVTIFRMRAPGMSINRIPIFCWSILVTSFAVLFAIPALNTANVFLWLERTFDLKFFDTAGGGSPLLWQHLFWVFGHPDVYIIVLPAFGFVSEIIQTFSRRPLVAYNLIAMSTVLTGIIGFGVWAHHMFATGISPLSGSFFAAASVIIALPAGVQVFAWIATILSGKPNFKTPLLFAAGFIVLFVMGGVTGVMFPVIAFDRQVTDTYFVVAHFHYVLVGGMVFPLFGAFYYWFPKMTGKVLNDTLGKWNFWLMFIGFNVAFFVQHLLGLLGMPRRIYTYLPEMGWGNLNLISTLGAYTIAAGVVLFIVNVYWSLTKRGDAGDNPWNGATLEWASSSPPPPYNFRTIPPVTSMAPLWERHNVEAEAQGADTAQVDPTDPFLRETIGTTLLEARPEEIIRIPPESAAPFFVAGAMFVFFTGTLLHLWWISGVGVAGVFVFSLWWLWPHKSEQRAAQQNSRQDRFEDTGVRG